MRSPSNRELLSVVVWLAGATAALGLLLFVFSQRDARRVAALSRTVETLSADVERLDGALSGEIDRSARDRSAIEGIAARLEQIDRDLAAAILAGQQRGEHGDVVDEASGWRDDLARIATVREELRASIAELRAEVDRASR